MEETLQRSKYYQCSVRSLILTIVQVFQAVKARLPSTRDHQGFEAICKGYEASQRKPLRVTLRLTIGANYDVGNHPR